MSEHPMLAAIGKFRVAHASRVLGFGVAPKRTFSAARMCLWALVALNAVVCKVREPETGSPARQTRALPDLPQSAM